MENKKDIELLEDDGLDDQKNNSEIDVLDYEENDKVELSTNDEKIVDNYNLNKTENLENKFKNLESSSNQSIDNDAKTIISNNSDKSVKDYINEHIDNYINNYSPTGKISSLSSNDNSNSQIGTTSNESVRVQVNNDIINESSNMVDGFFNSSIDKKGDSTFNTNVDNGLSNYNSLNDNSIENKNDQNNSYRTYNNSKHTIYVGYEVRIIFSVLISITFFAIACVFLIKAASNIQNKGITYDETSTIDYSVCLLPNDYYREECLGSGMEYLSEITKNIPVTFNYNAIYTSKIDYDYKYYVKSTLKIFRPDEESKILYTSEESLTNKTNLSATSNVVSISENVEVPFAKYNKYVTEYNNRYSLDSDSYVEVALYLEDKDKVKKKLGKVVIPLSTQTFNVTKDEISNHNLVAASVNNTWKKESMICAIVSCVFSLLGIFVIIKLIIFLIKTSTKKSKYQIKLKQILKEYDRIIVQVRDGEVFTSNKKIIKVHNFLELLDARDTLEKPIVYVKVNNIKSEFYVEDIDKVYKYVMKEADFE